MSRDQSQWGGSMACTYCHIAFQAATRPMNLALKFCFISTQQLALTQPISGIGNQPNINRVDDVPLLSRR